MQDGNFFERVGAKNSFFLGLGSGFAVFFVVGFFVVLTMYMKGGPALAGVNPTVANDPTNGQPTEIKVSLKDDDWVRGDKKAKVAIVTFSDTECPFCKRFHGTMQQVMEQYKGKVKWIYRNFPLEQLHSYAPKEAEGLECAAEIGGVDGMWRFLDKIMETTQSNDSIPPTQLPDLAAAVGLDKGKISTCITSGKYTAKVQASIQEAVAAGGTGTPYSIIISGDTKIPVNGAVPISQMQAYLDPLVK